MEVRLDAKSLISMYFYTVSQAKHDIPGVGKGYIGTNITNGKNV